MSSGKSKEERYARARQLIDEAAASGKCADYIDVQVMAKGRGLDAEVDSLLARQSVRDEVKAMCREAQKDRR
jgi:hypothetical protein